MGDLGTEFSGGFGSARLMVWLDYLKGLFQLLQFYDSLSLFLKIAKICSIHNQMM